MKTGQASAVIAVFLGVGVMAYGLWHALESPFSDWMEGLWQAAWIGGGLAVACAGGYAVGKVLAEE